MSKAFTKDDAADMPLMIAARAPLPPGIPNYVTPRGLRLLRSELQELQAERSRAAGVENAERRRLVEVQGRLAELEKRLATVELVEPALQPRGEVRFGAHVTVRTESGEERRYQLVGVDESDVVHGRVAFISPLARSLLGRRVGEVVTLRTPRGSEELEIVGIHYADAADG